MHLLFCSCPASRAFFMGVLCLAHSLLFQTCSVSHTFSFLLVPCLPSIYLFVRALPPTHLLFCSCPASHALTSLFVPYLTRIYLWASLPRTQFVFWTCDTFHASLFFGRALPLTQLFFARALHPTHLFLGVSCLPHI